MPGVHVAYRVIDPAFAGGRRLAAVVPTAADGSYEFESVPAGSFIIEAAIDTNDRAVISGLAVAGSTLTGQNLIIEIVRTAQVSGVVRFPDGTPAGGAIVTIGDRGVLSRDDGTFTIQGVAVRPNAAQTVQAITRDARRRGTASVFVNQSNEQVAGVVVTLSVFGAAEFQVLDPAGQPLAGQDVFLLFTGDSVLMPGCSAGCGCALEIKRTNALGIARFENIPPGPARARVMRFGTGFSDVVEGVALVPRDNTTGSAVLRFNGVGSVSGIVYDPDGQPAFGADIELRSVYFTESCSLSNGISHRVRTDTPDGSVSRA